jgi:hypothetical protein
MHIRVNGYLVAAIDVLRYAERLLTVREITSEALRRGLLKTAGKTPHASMSSRLYVATRNRADFPIERVFEAGRTRAARGSVRWRVRQ